MRHDFQGKLKKTIRAPVYFQGVGEKKRMITSFDQVIAEVQTRKTTTIAVAGAEDPPVLQAVTEARSRGICEAVLVGKGPAIEAGLKALDCRSGDYQIVHVEDGDQAVAETTVALVLEGSAGSIMKGFMDTSTLLKAVLAEKRLKTEGYMTVFGIVESPYYKKLLFLADSGFIIRPTLEQKVDIIRSGTELVKKLGVELPKIAVVCAVEKVNEKMPETLEAAELARMNREGKITGCIVEGPFGFDNAVSAEAAAHKGIKGVVPGDADILLFPDLVAANSVYKTFGFLSSAKTAGFLAGAKVPIIITSRSDSVDTKLNSLAITAFYASSFSSLTS
jgi:phosphate butyryltransferase